MAALVSKGKLNIPFAFAKDGQGAGLPIQVLKVRMKHLGAPETQIEKTPKNCELP